MININNVFCIEGLSYDSNCFLIDDILVDTGTGVNTEYLLDGLAECGKTADDISMVVNTHCHFDHVGGNYLFPNAKIAIHKDDAQFLKEDYNFNTAVDLFSEKIVRHDVDVELKENDKIGDFKVIHTPGHSPGCICLWDGEVLISGDTVFANGGVGRCDYGGNYNQLKDSLIKLQEFDVKYLLPGHGPWVDEGKKHIEFANSRL